MGIEDGRNMGFDQQRHVDSILNFPSSGMNTNSTSVWDPLVSLSQSENFVGSSVVPHSDFGNSAYSVGIGNQGMVHYQPDSGLVAMVPKLPCFGSGSFSELVGSFGLNECGQINTVGCPQNYARNQKDTIEKTTTNGGHSHGEQQISDEGGKVISPGGKGKKRIPESSSPIVHSKNGQGEQRKEISCDSPEYETEHNEKKQKTEQNMGANLRGKQTGKQVKDSPNSGDAAKENYIHVRARRGQATNSHSLAERVRRERISERMRLLQELVPGCNKITGKAVMLDEIINYVQSLQQQVEFLSMKLATVNPELNIDLDRILSKEMLHSRGGNGTISGFGAGMNSSHLYPQGIPQGALPSLPSSSPYHPMPQNVWDNEIQSLLQMGFESNPTINTLGPSGRPKMDL